MSNHNQEVEPQQVVAVKWTDRWQVYYRLRDLEIPCQCDLNQPLQITINNFQTAIQLWSVTKQVTAPRYELVHWLNNCWKLQINQPNN